MAGGERGTPAAAARSLPERASMLHGTGAPRTGPRQAIPLQSRGRGVSAPSISPSPPPEVRLRSRIPAARHQATDLERPSGQAAGVYEEEAEQGQEKEQRAMAYGARWRVINPRRRGNSEDGRRRRQNRAAQKVKLAGLRGPPAPNPHTFPIHAANIFSLSSPGFLFVYFVLRVLDGSGRCPLFLARLPFPSSSSCA
jgi:hypothetical protein